MIKSKHAATSPPGPMAKAEGTMLSLLKRHEIQVLLKAKHTQANVANLVGVSERTVRRVSRGRGSRPWVVEIASESGPWLQ